MAMFLINLYLQKLAADWIWPMAIVYGLVVYTEETGRKQHNIAIFFMGDGNKDNIQIRSLT